MRQFKLTLSTFFLLAGGSLFAEEACCDMPKPGPFAYSYPVDLDLNCSRSFCIYLEGLAMQAKQEGMDVAIAAPKGVFGSEIAPKAPITGGEVKGFSSHSSNWDMNPGLRLGATVYLKHDHWGINFNWTWINITNYLSLDVGTNLLIPQWGVGNQNPTGSGVVPSVYGPGATAKWDAKYNIGDIMVSKSYYISRYCTLNPDFGIRLGSVDQIFSIKYKATIAEGINGQIQQRGKNNFQGVGLRAGFSSNWSLGKGWSLLAHTHGSLMASKFDVKQILSMPASVQFFDPEGYNITNDFYDNTMNIDMLLGLAWSKKFNKEKYRVHIQGAYEFVTWFDQLRMKKFLGGNTGYPNDTVSKGDLSLNGFSLRLQLDT